MTSPGGPGHLWLEDFYQYIVEFYKKQNDKCHFLLQPGGPYSYQSKFSHRIKNLLGLATNQAQPDKIIPEVRIGHHNRFTVLIVTELFK
jgi:hypothetical protein